MPMDHRVALVGAGRWGQNLARVLRELGALAAVCDPSPAALDVAGRRWPGAACYSRLDELFANEVVDAVVLAAPAGTHAELAHLCLEAGKDVLVEKPLALTVAAAEALGELAQARGRILMVGHTLRYHPAVVRLLGMVREGQLGRIQYVYSHRLNIGRIRTEENVLWSFAPHDISVLLSLLDRAPETVACQGSSHLGTPVHDTTLSHLVFPSGIRAHVFVSWLHPFKEQRLVVVGSDQMAVFDDAATDKLVLYPHRVEWNGTVPTAAKADARPVPLDAAEPLREECRHFLECVHLREQPLTDAREATAVLRVLEACQESIARDGGRVALGRRPAQGGFIHETACVDAGAEVGPGTRVWHHAHVMAGARVGARCVLGQNVHVASGAVVGDGVKIQNNVSVYGGVIIEDDVFLGPSCVFTNVTNPRADIDRHDLFEPTRVRRGATVGANATILCSLTIGRHALVGAGAVVTCDVPDYALVVGNPARRAGWMSHHAQRLGPPDPDGIMRCPESGLRYREVSSGIVRCLDLDEEAPLPEELRRSSLAYREGLSASSGRASQRSA